MLHATHLYSYVGICVSYLGNTHNLALGALNNLDALWQVVCDFVYNLFCNFLTNATLKLYVHNCFSLDFQLVAN